MIRKEVVYLRPLFSQSFMTTITMTSFDPAQSTSLSVSYVNVAM
jgi:hypothetical protein